MTTQILIQLGFFAGLGWILLNARQVLKMAAASGGGTRPPIGPKPPAVTTTVKETDKKKTN